MTRTMIRSGMILALLACTGAAEAGGKSNQSPARKGELVLYEQPNYNGDYYRVDDDAVSIQTDWNVRSIAIYPGETWQICNKVRFQGMCLTLTESVPDASKIGVMGQVPSAKRVKQ